MNCIKANENPRKYDNLIIEESNNGKHFIRYYCKLPIIDEVANILNEAQTVLKDHLNGRNTADYIQTILHCYWPNVFKL